MRTFDRSLSVGFALAMLVAAPVGAQAQASFAGTWELDRFKSVYEPATTQPQRRVVTLEVKGDDLVSKAQTWRGDAVNEVVITAKLDGKEYPVPNQPATVSFKRNNATTIVRQAMLNGKLSETQTWTLSADGKVLTITAEGTDAIGTPIKSKQHYDRK
jgi:hypothetical protein